MGQFIPPANYPRIKKVMSFHELVSTPFMGDVNAMVWERTLPGDFAEVALSLHAGSGITTIEDHQLQNLSLSVNGRLAVEVLLEDQRLMRSHGLDPVLDCIRGDVKDESSAPVATDVYSFHADSATIQTDTYLCTYCGPSSEGLRNDEAQRRVDMPEIRARLLELFAGSDDEDFQKYLTGHCYDLHYAPLPGARPFPFGLGNLWRIAVEYPGSPVPPCIHRAPSTSADAPPRLLLIS